MELVILREKGTIQNVSRLTVLPSALTCQDCLRLQGQAYSSQAPCDRKSFFYGSSSAGMASSVQGIHYYDKC
ncbi:hypothetical protein ElyMa_000905000 [Elysia marginata]|uniref:Uncharacterized protein n=1 Tax=Elysia marginata TaxID=1093978 RepID=A0AAV4H830_9GAST|nr:hypothetical protein ElyMa_000905000 [Elysia marginata]